MQAAPQQGFDLSKMYVWVKGLETKANNLLREVNTLKNDFMRRSSDMKKEVKAIDDDILNIKREQEKVQQKMDLIIKELKKTAGVEEVQVIKKYLEYWNPINFVTQRDLERAIDSRISALKRAVPKRARKRKKSRQAKK